MIDSDCQDFFLIKAYYFTFLCLTDFPNIVYTVNIHIASRDDIYNKFVIKVESVMCYT